MMPRAHHFSLTHSLYAVKVLASFFVSAVLTFTSIIYGYFSDSLPLWYLNEADAAILAAYCNSSIHVTLTPRLAGSWNSATQIIRSLLRLSDPVAWKPLDRERRTEVVSRFILALSDQQLVTGLAILIGAFASRCTISVCLAWFSSTTHLATLDILRDYFIQNRMVRNFRVGGMVILTILWILGFVYARTHSTNADTFSQSISAMPLQCAVQAASEYNSNEFIDIGLGETFIIIFLFLFYYKRIWELFYSQRTKDRIPWSHRDFFLNLYMRSKFREMNIDAQISQKIIREAVFLQNWKRNKELLEKARRSRLVKSESTILLCYRAYVGSFSSNIPVFLFGLVYGIAQVSRVRWLEQPDIAEDADTMSFGQIVPLLLLTIPVLTAIEIYCGEQSAEKFK